MGEEYKNESIQISHTSSVTYYRLSLPKIISEDRCIYLDTDTIVLSDLSELFSLLSDEMLIAGVKAAGYYWPEESLKEKAKKLQINTFDAYVNAGVLVMNLKLMREIELVSVFHYIGSRSQIAQIPLVQFSQNFSFQWVGRVSIKMRQETLIGFLCLVTTCLYIIVHIIYETLKVIFPQLIFI